MLAYLNTSFVHGIDMNTNNCDCNPIHIETVEKVLKQMPTDRTLASLALLYKMFADQTRIKILSALDKSAMCVCDIAVLLNMTKSAVSHQLRLLRQAHLVKGEKQGKVVFYSLDDDHVTAIFKQGMHHINH